MNLAMFGAIYLQGRKWHPQLALVLSIVTCIVMIVLTYHKTVWIGLSLVLCLVYMFILRKPNETAAFTQLFKDHRIHPSQQAIPAALKCLGDKKWRLAEGTIDRGAGDKKKYYFWQGRTSSPVSTGRWGTTTSYSHYIAFIFPRGTIDDQFKRRVHEAADKSNFTTAQKLKYFFSPDTERPRLICEGDDGSFIVEYNTLLEVAVYERRIKWIEDNYR